MVLHGKLTEYVNFPSVGRIELGHGRLRADRFHLSVVDGVRFSVLGAASQRLVHVFDRRRKCQHARRHVAVRIGL